MTTPFVSLRGHRSGVIALLCDDDKHQNVLVSGGEDGTCRLWDVRTNRATKCINVKRALGADSTDDVAVNSMVYGTTSDNNDHHYLYIATQNKVLTFDIRQEGMILETASREIFNDAEDEINHLSLHPSKRGQYLAVPDDTGDVRIYDLHEHRLLRTLRGQHGTICMSAPFRPNAPWDLVSGGLDGVLVFWDFSRGRVKYKLDFNTNLHANQANQIWNPPLVHHVAFAPNGKSLVAAIGDGTVAVMDVHSRRVLRRLKNHAAAVNQVHFPIFHSTEWLMSCGNDAKVSIWNYSQALKEDNEIESSNRYLVKEFMVQHKPNAMTSCRHQNLIFIADTSKCITAYPLF